MGYLFYGHTGRCIEVPDRVLAHVKVVVATKLRRNESFTISWRHPEDAPRGRSTIWLHPSVPLRFVFEAAEIEPLDRDYLNDLALAAGSSGGMNIVVDTMPEDIGQLAASMTVRDEERDRVPVL